MKQYQYSCGCGFKADNAEDLTKIEFNPKIENINLDCYRTWSLISDGNTKGVFQLESRLGKSIAKKLKPENIEQLSALIAVLRPGCISGDTKISISRYTHKDGRIRQKLIKIRDLYKKQNSFTTILSYNEKTGTIINNKVNSVIYNGQKECFKVIFNTHSNMYASNGRKQYRLECTDDHQLLTSTGWKELRHIQPGERVLVNKRKHTRKSKLGKRSFRTKCYHTYEYKCIFCDWKAGSLDVNHIIENRHHNNKPNNLCFLCPNHHRQFTEGSLNIKQVRALQKKHKLPKTIDGKWATIVDKVSVGIKDVYDISMKTPHHNFIAGDVIVHNCLEAMRDGKSVTNHYIDKKNGLESVDYFHPSLEPILKNTYGEMIYQEQAMEIAKRIAGFNLQEADMLRKAIGKKKPEEMAKVKQRFLEGAKQLDIISEQDAEQIFGWIEKSQRYSFNKSHSVSYAINAYLSAYTKAHFPKIFFASYLRFAKDKIDPQEEIKALVQNANEMDITIHTPDLRNLNKLFILKNNKIYFGLTDIKGVGDSVFDKLKDICANINLSDLNWLQVLFLVLDKINSTAAKGLIQSGSISFINKSRNSMMFEYGLISGLTKKEKEHLINGLNDFKDLGSGLMHILNMPRVNKNRKQIILDSINTLNNPPYSLEDSPEWIADCEDTLLGCSITCSKLDMYDISMTNITCKELKNTVLKDNLILGGEIDFINITKTKTGKNPGQEMAFVTMTDTTGSIDSIIFFPEKYKEYKNLLFANNIIIVKGTKTKTGDGLIVDKAYVAKT